MRIQSEESKEKPISKRAMALMAITLALGLALLLAAGTGKQEQNRRAEAILFQANNNTPPVSECIVEVPVLLQVAKSKKTEPIVPATSIKEAKSNIEEPQQKEKAKQDIEKPEPDIPKVYDVALDGGLQKYLITKARKAGVDPELVLAVMLVESSCRNIVSDDGDDFGLMQINKVNHKWLAEDHGLSDIMDPKQNIDAGILFLAEYSKKYDELYQILMSYNCGESRAKELWDLGLKDTNVGYVERVEKALKTIKKV